MKKFEPQTLKYIEHIDELLLCLDLTQDDIKNIHKGLLDLEDGVLQVNSDSYGTSPFEDLCGWIEFSINILDDGTNDEEHDNFIKSLEKLLYFCPKDLYLKRETLI
jgi:hypothetical protein